MASMIEGAKDMAYVGSTPWHGMGQQLTPETIEEMRQELTLELGREATITDVWMRAASLEYGIAERELRLALPDGSFPELVGCTSIEGGYAEDKEMRKGWKAIVRDDTNKVFSIPSRKYEIVQNHEIVDLFREYCEAGHASMETVGQLRGGAVVWALAKLNGGSSRTLKGDDTVNGYVLFSTSHDGSMPTMGKATQVRVVCHNTLSAAYNVNRGAKGKARYDAKFSMKHSSKWTAERAKEAKVSMELATEQSARFNALSARLSEVSIDQAGRLEFIERLLGNGGSVLDAVVDAQTPPSGSILDAIMANHESKPEDKMSRVGKAILDAILTSPGSTLESAANTMWGAVNGVTYYVDHVARRSQESRLSQGWFGEGEKQKTEAVNIALEMAGIDAAQF
jgi:phage/plasmid-like protein (TIGR03299 family)